GDEGWVMAKFVDVFVALDSVPVTGTVVAAPTSVIAAPGTLPAPPAYPFIANVTDHARQLFLFGATLGNRPDVFSKVGDSITVSDAFLKPIGWGNYHLREHSNLQPVIDFYSPTFARDSNSFANTSLAAKVGWPAQALLSPQAADADYCAEGEAPLVCEYRWVRPSVALIMLGTNDVPGTSAARFERHMREVIEISMEMGVVPIVGTIPPMQRAGVEGRVESLNAIITNLAYEYDVPLWDYGSALQGLPDQGLISDGVHPSLAPNSSDFTPENLQYGMAVRNLTALQALDAVWRLIVNSAQ
ncbi:MAG TPA: SGNH/GDSL hydrolase family protein, partial [Anaerolineales bacterium]|nr:SGNH/GDSL hydrolase family protein [Anaerolineales bacterium]